MLYLSVHQYIESVVAHTHKHTKWAVSNGMSWLWGRGLGFDCDKQMDKDWKRRDRDFFKSKSMMMKILNKSEWEWKKPAAEQKRLSIFSELFASGANQFEPCLRILSSLSLAALRAPVCASCEPLHCLPWAPHWSAWRFHVQCEMHFYLCLSLSCISLIILCGLWNGSDMRNHEGNQSVQDLKTWNLVLLP